MIVLCDMDGVLTWFEEAFDRVWRERFPNLPQLNRDRRETFFLEDELGEGKYHNLITSIFAEPDFFLNLPEVPGAVEGINRLAKKHDVYICTAPLTAYEHCVLEKYKWVHQHLGFEWTKRIIITKHKFLVGGDILIDDTPDVAQGKPHIWKQLLFETPYSKFHNLDTVNWKTVDAKLSRANSKS